MNGHINIVFICGSLEPGRDGVGDYTRRFSAELISRGHQVGIVAINDRHLQKEFIGFQEFGNISIPVLRISGNIAEKDSFKRAGIWIDSLNPEWLSLQFVPFSFHKKGLPFGFSAFVMQLSYGRKLQIMFHELWVGMNHEANVKLVCWGKLQKLMIKSLVKRSLPLVVTTQTPLYQVQLKRIGIDALILPLFSNIRVFKFDRPTKKANQIKMIVFGGVYKGAPIEAFAKETAEYAKFKEIEISMTFIGRGGDFLNDWVTAWKSEGLTATVLGEQSEDIISFELSKADFGIVNTPCHLIAKSGVFAAMKEHGLPIICLSHNWTINNIPKSMNQLKCQQYRSGNLEQMLAALPLPIDNTITAIIDIFLKALYSGRASTNK